MVRRVTLKISLACSWLITFTCQFNFPEETAFFDSVGSVTGWDTHPVPHHTTWAGEDTHRLASSVACHCDVPVCGGERREKEKLNSFSVMKTDGTGDVRAEENSVMGGAFPAI